MGVEELFELVKLHTGISKEDIIGGLPHEDIRQARVMSSSLMRQVLRMPVKDIGVLMGGKTSAAISYYGGLHIDLMKNYSDYARTFRAIKEEMTIEEKGEIARLKKLVAEVNQIVNKL